MAQLQVLIALFLVIAVGFAAGRSKLFPKESTKLLNAYVFYIAVPSIIVDSLIHLDPSQVREFPPFMLLNGVFVAAGLLVCFYAIKVSKWDRKTRGSLFFTMMTGNVVYFGFPVILGVFGQDHMSFAVVYAVLVTTIGDVVAFLLLELDKRERRSNKKQLVDFIKNPIVIASLVGMFLFLARMSLPNYLSDALQILGGTTTGVALFSLGIFLSYHATTQTIDKSMLSACVKLLITPAIVYALVFYVFPLQQTAAQVSVIMTAMPTAVFSIIVADAFDLDQKLAANTVILSSLLSLVTIAFWVGIVS